MSVYVSVYVSVSRFFLLVTSVSASVLTIDSAPHGVVTAAWMDGNTLFTGSKFSCTVFFSLLILFHSTGIKSLCHQCASRNVSINTMA